jgi:hypothetical protein
MMPEKAEAPSKVDMWTLADTAIVSLKVKGISGLTS